jgi:hypothetical protein
MCNHFSPQLPVAVALHTKIASVVVTWSSASQAKLFPLLIIAGVITTDVK